MSDLELQKEGHVYLCPSCGSLSLDLPALVGGTAKCKPCGWEGPTNKLVVTAFQHNQGSDDVLVRRMMGEYRALLAKEWSLPLGHFLIRWGFIGTRETEGGQFTVNPDHLKKYLTAIFTSSVQAIIQVREEIEQERVDDGQ